MIYTPAIKFDNEQLFILDQTLLPGRVKYIEINSLESAYNAIKSLQIRGAPAIGIMAAYSMYILACRLNKSSLQEFKSRLSEASERLKQCRPTAVNLGWSIDKIQRILKSDNSDPVEKIISKIRATAIQIHEKDKKACEIIGNLGMKVLPNPCNIITHCNTGALATGGWGTALGIIYAATENKYTVHVYVDETRPLGQGARLTFWELQQNKIPTTLITDGAAASIMSVEKIDAVIFGADRIAANGDVANKIGSYSLAVCARYHKIPCYVAAPISTIDFTLSHGSQIQIEERSGKEILQIYDYNNNLLPVSSVYNPAFDVTPAHLISAIITEYGVLKPPLDKSINEIHKQLLEEIK